MDAGFAVALGFVGIGLLWLLAVDITVGVVDWLRKVLG